MQVSVRDNKRKRRAKRPRPFAVSASWLGRKHSVRGCF